MALQMGCVPPVNIHVWACADLCTSCLCVLQAESEVTKLETRLNTNLLKRMQELSSDADAPDLVIDK